MPLKTTITTPARKPKFKAAAENDTFTLSVHGDDITIQGAKGTAVLRLTTDQYTDLVEVVVAVNELLDEKAQFDAIYGGFAENAETAFDDGTYKPTEEEMDAHAAEKHELQQRIIDDVIEESTPTPPVSQATPPTLTPEQEAALASFGIPAEQPAVSPAESLQAKIAADHALPPQAEGTRSRPTQVR